MHTPSPPLSPPPPPPTKGTKANKKETRHKWVRQIQGGGGEKAEDRHENRSKKIDQEKIKHREKKKRKKEQRTKT